MAPHSTTGRLRLFALAVGLTFVVWATFMQVSQQWALFADNWFMTLTMVFGSFMAGASSEGGGAIAYPVMTLVFGIAPDVARNFSLAIQSVGMTAAALWIFANRIPVERTYLKLGLIGGTIGIVIGTFGIAPHVPAAYSKMLFVSFWMSYGIALFLLNHIWQRTTRTALPALSTPQRMEIIGVGIIGGILSAILGNGLDICTFAFVTLKYRISEKIATPTSVVLMASNAVVGFFLHGAVLQDMQPEAINYWLVSIPVVIFGAPFGAFVVSKLHRLVIASLLYVIIVAQFVGALLIIRPSATLLAFSGGVFLFGCGLFFWLTRQADTTLAETPST
jgi:uncharacterized membrane protein YfcA